MKRPLILTTAILMILGTNTSVAQGDADNFYKSNSVNTEKVSFSNQYKMKVGARLFLPKELEEASYLDGCGTLRTFTKIMLPAATAVMTTVFLLALAWQWTDTVFSPLFLDEVNILSKNVSALAQSAGKPIEVANYVNIGAVLAVLPIALIYIVLQKFFVESIDRAGIVG